MSEADKDEIAQEICEGCKYYKDGGWCDGAYGYPQYFEMMECVEETHPSEEFCPYHEKYTDIVGEEEEEITDEESANVLD